MSKPAQLEHVQPFPKRNLLAENLNRTLRQLSKQIGEAEGAAYSYVVKSVRMDRSGQQFEQHGSGPWPRRFPASLASKPRAERRPAGWARIIALQGRPHQPVTIFRRSFKRSMR